MAAKGHGALEPSLLADAATGELEIACVGNPLLRLLIARPADCSSSRRTPVDESCHAEQRVWLLGPAIRRLMERAGLAHLIRCSILLRVASCEASPCPSLLRRCAFRQL